MGLKFIDLFAGIGGFRLGMQLAGHHPVGWVEWDKFARKSYEAIHEPGEEWTAHDITTVSDDAVRGIGSIDVICGGFPCQAFSVAGKRAGFNDTRGTLFFEIMRFASILRPRYLFLENVVGLLNHENGNTFETILRTMDEVGYDAEWDVLNSKDFGVPQNRERVFIIGHLRGASTRKVFPLGDSNERPPKEPGNGIVVLQKTHGATTTMKVDETGTLQAARLDKVPCIVRPVLTPDREEKKQNGRRFKEPGEPMFTLTAQDKHGVAIKKIGHLESDSGQTGAVYSEHGIAPTILKQHGNAVTKIIQQNQQRKVFVKEIAGTIHGSMTNNQAPKVLSCEDYRIRKLTPRECWRLQGFPDWAFDRAAAVNSDSQLYKQAGNSVTVNVIQAIASQLI